MSAVKSEPDMDIRMSNGLGPPSNVVVPAGLSETEKQVYITAADYPAGISVSDVTSKIGSLLPKDVMDGINSLSKKSLLEFQMMGDTPYVRVVQMKDYAKTSGLDSESKLIYSHIKDAGNEGIWTKDLKKHTNLHLNVVNRCLKLLEQKQLVKAVKHVKWPTRRFYMLYEVTPSSEVTGGAWYTDQELDTDFIDTLASACYKYIYSRSFPRGDRNVIFKADYGHYPSAAEVKRFIHEKRISSVELSTTDIVCLLDLLIHDDMIEKKMPFAGFMDDEGDSDMENDSGGVEWVYKAINRNVTSTTTSDGGIDALSEIPCGKCPVFKFCTEDGPISPSNCEYFSKWLNF